MNSQWTIYHNPKCSKSREALQLLNEQGIKPTVIEYLKTSPNKTELKNILTKLKVPAKALVRSKDELYQDLQFNLNSEDEVLLQLEKHPSLLERPIVIHGSQAVIARPPSETLAGLFKANPPTNELKIGGIYQHYKGQKYKVHGVVKHSETLEDLVYYEALYPNELGQMWVRPYAMFFETVQINGETLLRFKPIDLVP